MKIDIADVATMWDLIERRAQLSPDVVVFHDEFDRTLTFRGLRDRAERVAAGLHALGIGDGTPVTWQLPTRIETVVVSMALARLGALQNPLIAMYREREVGFCLRQVDAEWFFHPGTWKGHDYEAMAQKVIAELGRPVRTLAVYSDLPEGDPATLPPPPPAEERVRWIYSTSGTTSEPKGVMHTDRTLMAGGYGLAENLDLGESDVGSIVFPYAHIAGPDYVSMLLLRGFGAVLMEAFVMEKAIPLFRAKGVTMAGGGPAFYQMYLVEQRKHPEEPLIPSLRFLSGGGAPMPPEMFWEVKRELHCQGALHGYGMTEVPMIAQGGPYDTDEQLANTVGKPVAGADVRIVKPDGTLAAPGEDGEVRVKGPMVTKGYTRPELTAEAFDEHGYFRTGDVGHIRPDGHVVLTGRLKDIIIRKGENIAAKEIEDLLYQLPGVGDVAVIGLPDRERGERVCAVIERVPGQEPPTFEAMVAHLRAAGLMVQKIPEQLEVVDAMPRNETLRKVLKYKLREEFAAKPWP